MGSERKEVEEHKSRDDRELELSLPLNFTFLKYTPNSVQNQRARRYSLPLGERSCKVTLQSIDIGQRVEDSGNYCPNKSKCYPLFIERYISRRNLYVVHLSLFSTTIGPVTIFKTSYCAVMLNRIWTVTTKEFITQWRIEICILLPTAARREYAPLERHNCPLGESKKFQWKRLHLWGMLDVLKIESKHSKSMQGKTCFRGGVQKRKKSGNIKLLHSNRN